jgi:hypothetical protein
MSEGIRGRAPQVGRGGRASHRPRRRSSTWPRPAGSRGVLLVAGRQAEAEIVERLGACGLLVIDPTTEDLGRLRTAVMRELRDGGVGLIRASLSHDCRKQLVVAARRVGAEAWLVAQPGAVLTDRARGGRFQAKGGFRDAERRWRATAASRCADPRQCPPPRHERSSYDRRLGLSTAILLLEARSSRSRAEPG